MSGQCLRSEQPNEQGSLADLPLKECHHIRRRRRKRVKRGRRRVPQWSLHHLIVHVSRAC
jgi:hypothetical protein